jgi:nitroreductase
MLEQHQITIQTIFSRRSVRSYLSKNIDKDTIDVLLQCAARAPTTLNEEPCEFLIIQDQEILKEISDIAKPFFIKSMQTSGYAGRNNAYLFTDPKFNIFYDANTLIVILSRKMGQYPEAGCWLAAENLMLAASSMGLGTCLIDSAEEALNQPYLKELLDIPEHMRAVCPIIAGFPNGDCPESPHKEHKIVSWLV